MSNQKKDFILRVRLTDNEKAELGEKAKQKGFDLSKYVRNLVKSDTGLKENPNFATVTA